MAELDPYANRFEFGRLFVDCGRVWARAWLPLGIGAFLLGVVPSVVASLPWWHGGPGTTPDAFRRAWTTVMFWKSCVLVATQSAASVFVVAVSLTLLTKAAWQAVFQPRRVAAGFVTSVCLRLATTWPNFISLFAMREGEATVLAWILWLAAVLIGLFGTIYFGVATTAAIAERRLVASAMSRSYQVLRRMRWRMAALTVGRLIAQVVGQYAVAAALTAADIPFLAPGVGQAALRVAAVLVAILSDAMFVSFFLQARQIADGPSVGDLCEVFA